MKLLLSMLSEDGGGQSVSTMRVAALLVVCGILAPRIALAIQTGTLPELSSQEVTLILGALGIKALQRKVENTEEAPKQ